MLREKCESERQSLTKPEQGNCKSAATSVDFLNGGVMSKMRLWRARIVLSVCAIPVLLSGEQTRTADSPEVPVVDAGLGSCRADFLVKDGSDKPLFNAKISLTIKYGFLGKRKSEVEIGTNSDGKARVTGLPNLPKKPLEFSIKSGDVSTTVTDDPSANCNATFNVTLTTHQ
jgi:hypothetical protein